MKLIEKLLKDLGIKGDLAKQIIEESKKEDSTFDITQAVDEVKGNLKNILENDSEFIDKFRSAEKAKQLDIFTRDLKKTFGLSSEEVKDKKIDEVVELVKTKMFASSSNDIKKLQEDLIQANQKIKKYEEEDIPTIKKEVDQAKKNIFIENTITKKIGDKKLRVAFDAANSSLMSAIKENYDLDIDDKKNISLLQKGTSLKALKADKSGELLLDEFIDGKFKEWKFIAESNADDNQGNGSTGTNRVIVQNDTKGNQSGFAGANKAQEALENARKIKQAADTERDND